MPFRCRSGISLGPLLLVQCRSLLGFLVREAKQFLKLPHVQGSPLLFRGEIMKSILF
jgi:hypothetical protein